MIKHLYLRDFRNYKEAKVCFAPNINLFWGDNAQGKTNLLEALYLFIAGRSFRTSHLAELIRFGATSFYLELVFEKNGIEQILRFGFDGEGRKILHNATAIPSLSALMGILNGVILAPEDRTLVKGGPAQRRQFLDLLLSQAKPPYLHHLSRYLRAMRQRNLLLKSRSLETIAIWEEQMADAAPFLVQMRMQTVDELSALCTSEALGTDRLDLEYCSQAATAAGIHAQDLKSFFLQQFAKNRNRECTLGLTLSGPHRDDLSIFIHNKEARQFASEGQLRSCVVALKLAQWKWLRQLADKPPILCIDDIGISFDASRENQLYSRVEEFGQVFITSVRPSFKKCNAIQINGGTV